MEMAVIVAGLQALLMPIAGGLELAEMERQCPGEMVGLDEKRRGVNPMRELDRFVNQLRCLTKVGTHVIDVSKSSYRCEKIRIVAKLPAQLPGAFDKLLPPRATRTPS